MFKSVILLFNCDYAKRYKHKCNVDNYDGTKDLLYIALQRARICTFLVQLITRF